MKGHRPNSNTLAIPVPDKEPAGRRSSGLAHLMSALHQNAAAVVNSKTQLNGPDQVKIQILKEKKFLVYFPWALDNFQNCLWPFSDLLKVFSSMAKIEFWIFQLFPYNRYSRIPFLEDQRSWNSKINICDYLPYFSEYPTHDPLIWPRLAPSPYGEILYMSGISTHTEYT